MDSGNRKQNKTSQKKKNFRKSNGKRSSKKQAAAPQDRHLFNLSLGGKRISVKSSSGGSGSGKFTYTEVIKFVLHDGQDLPISLSYLTMLMSNTDTFVKLRTFRVNYICAIFTRSTVTEPAAALSLAICACDDTGAGNDIAYRSPAVMTKPSSYSKVTVHQPRANGPTVIDDLLTSNPPVGRITHIGYYGTGSNIVGTLYVNVTVGCEFLDSDPLTFETPLLHVPLVDDVNDEFSKLSIDTTNSAPLG